MVSVPFRGFYLLNLSCKKLKIILIKSFRPLPGFLSSQYANACRVIDFEPKFPSPSGVSIFSMNGACAHIELSAFPSPSGVSIFSINKSTVYSLPPSFPSPSGVSIFSIMNYVTTVNAYLSFPSPSGVSIFSILCIVSGNAHALPVSVPFRGFYLLNNFEDLVYEAADILFPSPSGVSIFSMHHLKW